MDIMNKNPHRINNYKKFETIPISYYTTSSISKTIRFSTNNRISEIPSVDTFGNEWWTYPIKIEFTLDSVDIHTYQLTLLSDSNGQWYVRWTSLIECGIAPLLEPIDGTILSNVNTFSKWIGDELSNKLVPNA